MNAAENLSDDIKALKVITLAQQEQNARLETLISAFKQAIFGCKSEKIDPDQFELALEETLCLLWKRSFLDGRARLGNLIKVYGQPDST